MKFPKIQDEVQIARLQPPTGKISMVLDTDTYNEVDDQFALAYAIRSQERIQLQAVYAAPFHNNRSNGPEDGMEKSYEEIIRILDKLHVSPQNFVFKGSRQYLQDWEHPQESEAVHDLIQRAMNQDTEPLYVVAIGAITNIASAILLEPKIIEKIVLVWLGGNALHWPHAREFNLAQDIPSSKLIFDCGVPLIHIPCMGVTTHLHTTIPELEQHLYGKSDIGDYLVNIVKEYTENPFAWSKVIWDVSTIAWLVNPEWVYTHLVHSPILTQDVTWSFDQSRHFIRSAYFMDRDKIFGDLFKKLSSNE